MRRSGIALFVAAGAVLATGWAAFAAAGPNRLGIDRAAAKALVADLPGGHVNGLGRDPLTHIVLYALAASGLALVAMRVVSALRERRELAQSNVHSAQQPDVQPAAAN